MQKIDGNHRAHVEECLGMEICKRRHAVRRMQRLQKSFANENECQGLRLELDASKKREKALESQQAPVKVPFSISLPQVVQERVWNEERADLEKELGCTGDHCSIASFACFCACSLMLLHQEVARLRAREASLVQQLQQAIVEVPPSPLEASSLPQCLPFLFRLSLNRGIPPVRKRKPRFSLALAMASLGLILAGDILKRVGLEPLP